MITTKDANEKRWHKLRAWQKTLDSMIKQIDEEMLPRVCGETAPRLRHASNALFEANTYINAAANQIAFNS